MGRGYSSLTLKMGMYMYAKSTITVQDQCPSGLLYGVSPLDPITKAFYTKMVNCISLTLPANWIALTIHQWECGVLGTLGFHETALSFTSSPKRSDHQCYYGAEPLCLA
jgi:hypothetical protein